MITRPATANQIAILKQMADGASLHSFDDRYRWIGFGSSARHVTANTLTGLIDRDLIEEDRTEGKRTIYRLTEAGRKAAT